MSKSIVSSTAEVGNGLETDCDPSRGTHRGCPAFDWCVNEHRNSDDNWHEREIVSVQEQGSLRTDYVFDGPESHLSIVEMLDWQIPEAEIPSFVAKLRAYADVIEEAHRKLSGGRTLHRRTEPGSPSFEEAV